MGSCSLDTANSEEFRVRSALYDRLLYDLADLDFDWEGILPNDPDGIFGNLPPDASVMHVRCLALAKSLCKKWPVKGYGQPTEVAMLKFLEANAACADWKPPKWDGSCESDFDRELYGEWKRCIHRFFEQPHHSSYEVRYPQFDWYGSKAVDKTGQKPVEFTHYGSALDWARVAFFGNNGPGSAIGSVGGSWAEKFDCSTLTYSREFLRDLYQQECLRSQTRLDQEIGRALRHGWQQVTASKFSTVPKTVSEDRAICIEPSLNMYFQKGVQLLLEDRLKSHYHIDLSNQQVLNGQLAYKGSVDGSYATEDLSSASDTISLLLIKEAVPSSCKNIILALRTPAVEMPWGDVQLHMVSSMGNAFTFPLQTALFAAAVEAVYNLLEIELRFPKKSEATGLWCPGNFAVNGDDIIVVTEAHNYLVRLLKLLGFRPNLQKSFNTGFFRESCGFDYYRGHYVRGVYCKTLSTEQDVYSLINRLNRWSAMSGVGLKHTVGFLLRKCKTRLVPLHESDVAGIKVPSELVKPPKPFKHKKVLTFPAFPTGQHTLWYEPQWSYLACVPEPRRFPMSELTALGALISIAKGEMTPEGISVRNDKVTQYRDRWLTTQRWDSSEVGLPFTKGETHALIAACIGNMSRPICSVGWLPAS